MILFRGNKNGLVPDFYADMLAFDPIDNAAYRQQRECNSNRRAYYCNFANACYVHYRNSR